jgi:glycolate oxidase FAD binding subunit
MTNPIHEVQPWANIPRICPSTISELSACLAESSAPILPSGNGSKLHWGGLSSEIDSVISTAHLNQLVEHAVGDLTVTAEAGMPLATLQKTLAAAGQFLPIDPSYAATATLGGIVATGDTGALRQRYGGIRDLLIGLSFVRADGQMAKAGGRVVKNVAGYDLMKLFTGSYGTLGIITQVTFRIYPLPSEARTVLLTGADEGIHQALSTLLASALTPTAIALIPAHTLPELKTLGLAVRFQNIDISVVTQASQLLKVGEAIGLDGQVFVENEADLWQALQQQMETATPDWPIACKIGVLPAQIVNVLGKLAAIAPVQGALYGVGLGMLRMGELAPSALLQMRQICQNHGGFLTVLEAPLPIKREMDVWGYPGNALDYMKKIKHQFDPQNRLSPGRFISGI